MDQASNMSESSLPIEYIETDDHTEKLRDGITLSLSGGGYRAMLFHLGSLWRLYEIGMLSKITKISSVSGGSITSAMLGLKWHKLSFDPTKLEQDFVPEVVNPVRKLAGKTIDRGSILGGMLLPGVSISDKIIDAYREYLFNDKTLQDFPGDNECRFVINATNVQSGALWRFMKPYMRDWRVGEVKNPTVELATAVAASSAFPPFLSPLVLPLEQDDFTPNSGYDLQMEPYTTEVILSDGGVYDNLGLETCFKRYNTLLVSDAGGQLKPEEEPKHDWAQHSYRVLNLIDNQVRCLRKRQLIECYKNDTRQGAYWGIRTNIANYELADSLHCPHEWSMALAETPTRLKRLPALTQEGLINWGYASCDAALRSHVDAGLMPPDQFPYPGAIG